MNIHEYQAKKIFSEYGIPVHQFRVVKTPDEAFRAAGELAEYGPMFSVKAQVHAGARGKGGGIKIVKTPEQAKEAAQKILGRNLVTPQTGPEGKPVDQLLMEATVDMAKEFYVSVILDRKLEKPCLIVSSEGGMDIEEVAKTSPEKIAKKYFSIDTGLEESDAAAAAEQLVDQENLRKPFSKVLQALSRIFLELDASLVEINPLAIMENGELIAIDAKINFDDNALYKHPQIAALRDPRQEDPREVEAKKFDLSYVGLSGNIGCIVNGAGLAMATMDIIKYAGGEPANFLDVGGGASKEKVAGAFKILLTDPNVKVILINIFGGIMRCDIVAEGIVAAYDEFKNDSSAALREIPLVVRLEGTNVKEGRKILEDSPIKLNSASNFEEAAKMAVALL